MAWDCKWKNTAGCRELTSKLAEMAKAGAMTMRALAKRLGTTEGTVYAWKVGFRRPGPSYREALERILGIPRDAWLTREERERERRLRAA